VGYIYNDLKPDNICVGIYRDSNSLHILKLIDFGLALPYLQLNEITGVKEHVKCVQKNFQGNLAFSSKNAFNETTLSRRDDLISLVYMLTYLSSGKLPFIRHEVPLVD
jgi:casein kinase I homolog HRR25